MSPTSSGAELRVERRGVPPGRGPAEGVERRVQDVGIRVLDLRDHERDPGLEIPADLLEGERALARPGPRRAVSA